VGLKKLVPDLETKDRIEELFRLLPSAGKHKCML
jgi:hypothetical protein